ncbi:hypothetical protein D3C71_439950 [compost metagenome]
MSWPLSISWRLNTRSANGLVRVPLAMAWVPPARPSRWMRKGWSLLVSSSGDSVLPSSENGLPFQRPLPLTSSGGAPSSVRGLPLLSATSTSVRPAASRNCRRPSSISRRCNCGGLPVEGPRKSQLPGVSLPGPVSSSRSGRVRRTSGIRTWPRSSGHTRMAISARSALAICGVLAHDALAKVSRSARRVVVRPRSTSRSPWIWNSRPVLAWTARSTGPLNQFQSHSAISRSTAANRNTRIASQRCPRLPGRRQRQRRDAGDGAGESTVFTCSILACSSCRGCEALVRMVSGLGVFLFSGRVGAVSRSTAAAAATTTAFG